MKRLIALLLLLALFPGVSLAGGSWALTKIYDTNEGKVIHLTGTADAADGSLSALIPTAAMNAMDGGYSYTLVTEPGSPAPTDLSDLALTDSRGLVLLSATGNGENIVDATSTLPAYTELSGADHYVKIHNFFPITAAVTGNIVNSAIVNLYIETSNE